MLKTFEDTSLLTIRKGDLLECEDGRRGQLIDIELVPNGSYDPSIVVMLTVKLEASKLTAVSTSFKVIKGEQYLARIY